MSKQAHDWFDRLTADEQERILDNFKDEAWQFAHATGMAVGSDGRRAPPHWSDALIASVSQAAFNEAMRQLSKEAGEA